MMDWKPFIGLPLWFWLFVLPTILTIACWYLKDKAQKILAPIWRVLNVLYTTSGIIAAIFMVIILLLIVAQMIARWTGVTFHGSTEFAGYAMAATSFFALAHALNRGAHIRVSILLNLNNFTKRWVDIFALFVAALIATYFARYAIKANIFSEMLNDRTQGQDTVPEWLLTLFETIVTSPTQWATLWSQTSSEMVYTPLWLPQIPMSIGTTLLAIALWDNLIRFVVLDKSNIKGEMV